MIQYLKQAACLFHSPGDEWPRPGLSRDLHPVHLTALPPYGVLSLLCGQWQLTVLVFSFWGRGQTEWGPWLRLRGDDWEASGVPSAHPLLTPPQSSAPVWLRVRHWLSSPLGRMYNGGVCHGHNDLIVKFGGEGCGQWDGV